MCPVHRQAGSPLLRPWTKPLEHWQVTDTGVSIDSIYIRIGSLERINYILILEADCVLPKKKRAINTKKNDADYC